MTVESALRLPSLHEPYATAINEAAGYILERFAPVGIVACGSVLRGHGHASSDLDLYVIHLEPWRQRVQKFFHGVPAEIFVNPPETIRGYFVDEGKAGRPITAHMLSSGVVIWQTDPVLDVLRTEAKEYFQQQPNKSEDALVMARYMAATAVEDAFDIRHQDPANAMLILEQAMGLMIQHAFLSANQNLPRLKETVDNLANVDPALSVLARRFYTSTEPAARFDIAEAFARHVIDATGFFEWETKK
ncbi:hypothetical protein GC175_12470 [bacterium]|nr:hypothetical protein [bacterium]